MRILFIGDVVGKPGREIIERAVPGLVREERLDLVVANAENAAGGSGITPGIYRELVRGWATLKIRFFGDGPTDAHVTTGVCSTPGFDQSQTPPVKMAFSLVRSLALTGTL